MEKELQFSLYSTDQGFIGITPGEYNDKLEYNECMQLINFLIRDTMVYQHDEINHDMEDEHDIYIDNLDNFRNDLVDNVVNAELITEQVLCGYQPTRKIIICNVLDTHHNRLPLNDVNNPEDIKVYQFKPSTYTPMCSIISEDVFIPHSISSMFQTLTDIIDSFSDEYTKEELKELSRDVVDQVYDFANEYIDYIGQE